MQRDQILNFQIDKKDQGIDISNTDLERYDEIGKAAFEKEVAFERNGLAEELKCSIVYTAKINGSIVGYLVSRKNDFRVAKLDNQQQDSYQNNYDRYHIAMFAIHPRYQNQQIGRSLMQALIRDAQSQSENFDLTLQCRPYNEPFYRKLGFKMRAQPKNYYLVDYYYYLSKVSWPVRVHGLFMQKTNDNTTALIPNKTSWPTTTPDSPQHELYRIKLLELASTVKLSTSCNYGGFIATLFGRSKRKEKAMDVIIAELRAIGDNATRSRKLNAYQVLQTIAHNAMMIRGYGILSKETTSGRALVKLLNSNNFVELRLLVNPDGQHITYQELKNITQLVKNEKSTDTLLPFSPYRHF